MFPLEAQYDERALDDAYVTSRDRWEPRYEVTQIKGDGETHPLLSPDDEFADYEIWYIGNLDVSEAKTMPGCWKSPHPDGPPMMLNILR